jgi:hypothetical protein
MTDFIVDGSKATLTGAAGNDTFTVGASTKTKVSIDGGTSAKDNTGIAASTQYPGTDCPAHVCWSTAGSAIRCSGCARAASARAATC